MTRGPGRQIIRNTEKPAVQLSAAFDLSEFSRWTKNDYQNFMTMFAKTVAERTSPGQRLDVEEQGRLFPFFPLEHCIPLLPPISSPPHPHPSLPLLDPQNIPEQPGLTPATGHTFHCYARSEGIAGIIISKDYPKLAAHQVLSKVVDEFLADKTPAEIAAARNDGDISFPPLERHLRTYQDPGEVNSIANIQKELDETKIVLHKTIESVSLVPFPMLYPIYSFCHFPSFSSSPSSHPPPFHKQLHPRAPSAHETERLTRTGPTTRREARRPRRQVVRPQRPEQDVLHHRQEAELVLRRYVREGLPEGMGVFWKVGIRWKGDADRKERRGKERGEGRGDGDRRWG